MQLHQSLDRLAYMHHLIYSKATGNADQFAFKLHICKRQLFYLIEELRDMDLPIEYSEERHTYYYSEDVQLNFEIKIGEKNIKKLIEH